ncbi:GGDEF domain-containing protein [Kineosporia rhizophila]|uniref:GGDEF domain-containing protein n=1 Tax=Kineosporia TaxID=49184 RepID=UPI001E510A4E|nr:MULTISPECIES: GGDEF domain-containing protein [Kineosporia]MCE0539867.1 GGDEF domain-containing protein [Kineosporia rhizophila]GLY19750.1 hypothetical protein Kisp01_67640 [Kineosporia sp. NBRC 101677]
MKANRPRTTAAQQLRPSHAGSVAPVPGTGRQRVHAPRLGTLLWLLLGAATAWQALVGTRLRQSLRQAEAACQSDPLTGLPNRRALHQELSDPRSGRPLMVGLVDLDKFKDVNDTYGHACGDALLVSVAHRLAQAMHGCGIAARLGGDEFVLVWHHVPGVTGAMSPGQVTHEQAAAEAQRILMLLSAQPVTIDGAHLRPEASIGVAIIEPGDEQHRHRFLHAADVAMYAAKQHGREGHTPVHVETVKSAHGPERRRGSRGAQEPEPQEPVRPQMAPVRRARPGRRFSVPRQRNRR